MAEHIADNLGMIPVPVRKLSTQWAQSLGAWLQEPQPGAAPAEPWSPAPHTRDMHRQSLHDGAPPLISSLLPTVRKYEGL